MAAKNWMYPNNTCLLDIFSGLTVLKVLPHPEDRVVYQTKTLILEELCQMTKVFWHFHTTGVIAWPMPSGTESLMVLSYDRSSCLIQAMCDKGFSPSWLRIIGYCCNYNIRCIAFALAWQVIFKLIGTNNNKNCVYIKMFYLYKIIYKTLGRF